MPIGLLAELLRVCILRLHSPVGYHVYSAPDFLSVFERITTTPTMSTSENGIDGDPSHIYMVRAVWLKTTPSGTYYNASQGAFSANQWDAKLVYAQDFDDHSGMAVTGFHASVTAGTPSEWFETYRTTEVTIGSSLANQDYVVRLYFSDVNVTASVFDVDLEGQKVLDDYDITTEVGSGVGVVKTFLVSVTGGDLLIDLSGTDPLLSAVEIFSFS